MSFRVGVLGGGEFGRSLTMAVARSGNRVIHYSRSGRSLSPEDTEALSSEVVATDKLEALSAAELLFIAVPSPYMDSLARELDGHLDGRHMLVHVSRGLATTDDAPAHAAPSLYTLSRRLRTLTACRRVGALAGPLVPESLATTKPGGAVVGTPFPEVADAVRAALGGPTMRIYDTGDLVGVELASACVGVLSIAVGIAAGMGVGPGALALLCTRGMSEASRIGATLGANPQTFAGLAGFGDLVACVAQDGRIELTLGRRLASGESIETCVAALGAHVEGIALAPRLAHHAQLAGLETPILEAMAALVGGAMRAEDALASLMARIVHKE